MAAAAAAATLLSVDDILQFPANGDGLLARATVVQDLHRGERSELWPPLTDIAQVQLATAEDALAVLIAAELFDGECAWPPLFQAHVRALWDECMTNPLRLAWNVHVAAALGYGLCAGVRDYRPPDGIETCTLTSAPSALTTPSAS